MKSISTQNSKILRERQIQILKNEIEKGWNGSDRQQSMKEIIKTNRIKYRRPTVKI